MIYRHKLFKLDSDLQMIYSNDGKELRITADSYILIFALCRKKAISIGEAHKLLGLSKEYRGRRVKEDVEKINHTIGAEVVVLKEVEGEFESETIIFLKDALVTIE